MDGRLFGLDIQLVFDALVMFVFIMLVYVLLTKLFFKPVRAFLEKRQEGIDETYAEAEDDRMRAKELRTVYEEKLKKVNKEAENLMSISRKEALKQQETMIDDARERAREIIAAAHREVVLEKEEAVGEVWRQSAQIAALLAAEFVGESCAEDAATYVEDIYKKVDGDVWYN